LFSIIRVTHMHPGLPVK